MLALADERDESGSSWQKLQFSCCPGPVNEEIAMHEPAALSGRAGTWRKHPDQPSGAVHFTGLQGRPFLLPRREGEGTAFDQRPSAIVADGDPDIREVLVHLLGALGIAALKAASCAAAVEIARRQSGEIELVLCDAGLLWQEGRAALAALGQVVPLPRCCFMVTGGEPDEVVSALGHCRLLVKPFSFAELTRCLVELQRDPDSRC
jgi:CheY-like chemotaxis protein